MHWFCWIQGKFADENISRVCMDISCQLQPSNLLSSRMAPWSPMPTMPDIPSLTPWCLVLVTPVPKWCRMPMVVDGPQAWVGDRVVDTHSAWYLPTHDSLGKSCPQLPTKQVWQKKVWSLFKSKLTFISDLFLSVFYCILKAGRKFEIDWLRVRSATSSLQEKSVKIKSITSFWLWL